MSQMQGRFQRLAKSREADERKEEQDLQVARLHVQRNMNADRDKIVESQGSEFDKLVQMREELEIGAETSWRSIWRGLSNERGAWGAAAKMKFRLVLDKYECTDRSRRRLRRLYGGCDHRDAAARTSHAPQVRDADDSTKLSVTVPIKEVCLRWEISDVATERRLIATP